jgi:peptidoglycan/xylan/chitin deacetylase (PgdA/CDA1 family)
MPKISFGVTNFSPTRLRRLLKFLTFLDYSFAPSNSKARRSVRITFDDAYQHLAEYLPPLIEEFGKDNSWDYSSTISRVRHLSEGQIKALADAGVEFGSHGHRHVDLTSLSPDALTRDLATSKTILEDILCKEVDCLSYPFGRVDRKVTDTAARLGYRRGYTMKFPDEHDTALSLGRYPVYSYDTLFSVRQKIAGGPLRRVENLKARLTTRLSGGTILWNRWFGRMGQ